MKQFLILALIFFSARPAAGESLETSVSRDGAQRCSTLFLYSGNIVSAAVSCRFSPDDLPLAMFGVNTSTFSVGHLGDAGLAAEVRNPGYHSLSRLAEDTVYRADLRSFSKSRIGLALMSRDRRAGVVWERRERIDAGIVWLSPLSLAAWDLEILGEAGLLNEVDSDDTWYPESPGRPPGPFAVISGRIRHHGSTDDYGVTIIVSGGINLRPGWMVAFPLNISSGPLRFRCRSIYSSPDFRNAEGDRLEEPVGAGFDFRYRPSYGLQFAIDYQGGIEVYCRDLSRFTDDGSASLGWRFGEIQLSLESDWNFIFSTSTDADPACRRLKGRITWDRKFLHLGLLGGLETGQGWFFRLENSFPAGGPLLVETLAEMHQEAGPLLVDFRIKTRWDIGKNRLVFSVYTGDIPGDWTDGPSSAEDFEVEIRWIRKFG